MKRNIISGLIIIILVFLSVGGKKSEVLAAGRRSYSINAQNIQGFKKSGGKLKIKGEKNCIHEVSFSKSEGYKWISSQALKKRSLNFKIAKNCKWKHRDVNGRITTVSYKLMKKKIKKEQILYKQYKRSGSSTEYETNFSIVLVVQRNRIVEVVAYGFF